MREHRWVTVVSFDRDYVQTGKVDLSDNLLTVTFRVGYQSGKMLYTADDQWQGYRKSIGKRRWFIGNQTEVRAVSSRTSKHHPIRTTIIIAVLSVVSLAVGYVLGGAGSVSKVNRPTDEKLTIAVTTIADNYANKTEQADYVASSVNDIASKELTQIDAYQVSEADAYLRRELSLPAATASTMPLEIVNIEDRGIQHGGDSDASSGDASGDTSPDDAFAGSRLEWESLSLTDTHGSERLAAIDVSYETSNPDPVLDAFQLS